MILNKYSITNYEIYKLILFYIELIWFKKLLHDISVYNFTRIHLLIPTNRRLNYYILRKCKGLTK